MINYAQEEELRFIKNDNKTITDNAKDNQTDLSIMDKWFNEIPGESQQHLSLIIRCLIDKCDLTTTQNIVDHALEHERTKRGNL